MALSCSTQILQRSWLVYFRQGTLCLASSAVNAGFRTRAFSSSSYVLRSHSRVSQSAFPVWRPRYGSSAFGCQSVRALASSSAGLESAQGSGQAVAEAEASSSVLEEEQGAKKLKDLQEDGKVTGAASVAEGGDGKRVEKNVDSSAIAAEDQYDMAVSAALQEGVEEALGSVDLLNDGGRPGSVSVSEPEKPQDQHPWPEWDKFLNMLEAGGHFIFDTETTDRRPVVRQEDDSGKIKRASMAFARNRDDVIKYESTGILVCIAKLGMYGYNYA